MSLLFEGFDVPGTDEPSADTPEFVVFDGGEQFVLVVHVRTDSVGTASDVAYDFSVTNNGGVPVNLTEQRWYFSSEQGPWRNSFEFGKRKHPTGPSARDRYGRFGTTVIPNAGNARFEYIWEFPGDGNRLDVHEQVYWHNNLRNDSGTSDDLVTQLHLYGHRIGGSLG